MLRSSRMALKSGSGPAEISRIILIATALAYGLAVEHSESNVYADSLMTLQERLVHLRSKSDREWISFPEAAEQSRLELEFDAAATIDECCLTLRQQDVKQQWFVSINGKRLGELTRDENDMLTGFAIPPGILKNGKNRLVIETNASDKSPSDDIRVGSVNVRPGPLTALLSEGEVAVTVVEAETFTPIPCRLTIVDQNGSLVPLGNKSDDSTAVRTGTVYTATGKVLLKLPVGHYTLYAGRGFEYSCPHVSIQAISGQPSHQNLTLFREVSTPEYVACDTHSHTLTHSGHGDASIAERMITLAGEGIELPVATDHNIHVDYESMAVKLNVRQHFTPIMGNEVTTPNGHFNIFPIQPDAPVVDHKQTDWGLLFKNIYKTPGVRVAILNHARDLHSGVRPFGPALRNSASGDSLEGRPHRFNGMEVVNSGAVQTDPLQLFHDWMTLLNRGDQVTPVGSSDSHDVARHFVGQARTYIRCFDQFPGQLNTSRAIDSFLAGRVMVSYGLLVKMIVNNEYSSGELARTVDGKQSLEVAVLGPHWVNADRIMLYANGVKVLEEAIDSTAPRDHIGQIWQSQWQLPREKMDQHLVAIAVGPGVKAPYWRTAKPYQPTSIDDETHVIGCSGAVWLDGDGDGRRTSARQYAEKLVTAHRADPARMLAELASYDQATAVQTAWLLNSSGANLQEEAFQKLLGSSSRTIQDGFRSFQQAVRASEIARNQPSN